MGDPGQPETAEYWKNTGNEYYKEKEFRDAISCYYRAIQLEPGYISAWHNMGMAYDRLGRKEDARKCFDREKELEQSGPKIPGRVSPGEVEKNVAPDRVPRPADGVVPADREEPQDAPAPVEPGETPSSLSAYCYRCGTPVVNEMATCPKCGFSVAGSPGEPGTGQPAATATTPPRDIPAWHAGAAAEQSGMPVTGQPGVPERQSGVPGQPGAVFSGQPDMRVTGQSGVPATAQPGVPETGQSIATATGHPAVTTQRQSGAPLWKNPGPQGRAFPYPSNYFLVILFLVMIGSMLLNVLVALVLLFFLSVAVYSDAKGIGVGQDWGKDYSDSWGPTAWAVLVFLLAIIFFPFYLARRRRLYEINNREES
ncbi:MAG: tetratricopeptide repeat protein [Methanoregulaceae archaeon]|nr:tetratricopeptide repeat protein [Methanoregulaceae archaeon]